MYPIPLSINPTTDVAAGSQPLVERDLNCLPVVEYSDEETAESEKPQVDMAATRARYWSDY